MPYNFLEIFKFGQITNSGGHGDKSKIEMMVYNQYIVIWYIQWQIWVGWLLGLHLPTLWLNIFTTKILDPSEIVPQQFLIFKHWQQLQVCLLMKLKAIIIENLYLC